jgi:hypothetical protein
VNFLDDFLCLKKCRLHSFAGKFIKELLDIRAISEKSEVKIEYNRYVVLQLLRTPYKKNRPDMSTYEKIFLGFMEKMLVQIRDFLSISTICYDFSGI